MRASLLVWCVVALAGSCRGDAEPGPPRSDPPPPITATPEKAAPLSATPEPTGATTTPPPSLGATLGGSPAAPSAPGTPARPPAARPPAQDAPQCQKDSDCAVTRVPDGDCCPSLCTPRAVTVAEAQRVQERVQRCEAENRPCRVPACMPKALEAACVAGACTARRFDDR